MSRHDPYPSRSSTRKVVKKVRFADNLSSYQSTGPSSDIQTDASYSSAYESEQPGPTRHSSLPQMGESRLRSRESRLHGLEALDGMRAYLKEACNFHGEHLRRALSVPSIDALCALIALVNALRADVDNRVTQRDEAVLRSLLEPARRHPHEQLTPEPSAGSSTHERNARRGHRKRMRREAEHHLLIFVSRQLRLPVALLRDLSSQQRAQRELDAFKARIRRFNVPGVLNSAGGGPGVNSAPQSPAQRVSTAPRSPRSVPVDGLRRAYELPDHSIGQLFPEMMSLNLPGSSFDDGGSTTPTSTAAAARPRRNKAIHAPMQGTPLALPYDPTYPSPATVYVGQTHAPPPLVVSPYAHPVMPPPASPYTGPAMYGTAAPPTPAPLIPPVSIGPPSVVTMHNSSVQAPPASMGPPSVASMYPPNVQAPPASMGLSQVPKIYTPNVQAPPASMGPPSVASMYTSNVQAPPASMGLSQVPKMYTSNVQAPPASMGSPSVASMYTSNVQAPPASMGQSQVPTVYTPNMQAPLASMGLPPGTPSETMYGPNVHAVGATNYPQPYQEPARAPAPETMLAATHMGPVRVQGQTTRSKKQSSYPSLQQLEQKKSLHPSYKTSDDRH